MISTKTLLLILTYACSLVVKSRRGNSCDHMLIDVVTPSVVKFVMTNGATMMVFTVSLPGHAFSAGKQYLIHRVYLDAIKSGITSNGVPPRVFICPLGDDIVVTGGMNRPVPTTQLYTFPDYGSIIKELTNNSLLFELSGHDYDGIIKAELVVAPV